MAEHRDSWQLAAAGALRRLAVVSLAGALLGLLVGGIGGRLAMTLLARLNPEATGVISDDGFRIGQTTLSGTLNLLLVTTFIGVVGAAIFLVLRPLRIGPGWFQRVSVAAGAAVVVGALLVHDGVDFTILQPAGLAITLFVAIPAVYAILLVLLADRWLSEDGVLLRSRSRTVFLPLLLWIPLLPALALLSLGWVGAEALRRAHLVEGVAARRALPLAGRVVLTVVFTIAAADLARDVSTFT